MTRFQSLAVLLAFGALLSATTEAAHAQNAVQTRAVEKTSALPLRSRAQLDRWLRDARAHGRSTPLDALSPAGRSRFLDSLEFGSRGLGSMNPDDLRMELTPTQARAILALFGEESALAAVRPRRKDVDAPLPAASSPEIERAFDTLFRRTVLQRGTQTDAVAQLYASDLAPNFRTSRLHTLALRDLLLLQRAAALMTQRSRQPEYLDDAITVANELDRRGRAVASYYADAIDALLRRRDFDAARALSQRHRNLGLPVIPVMQDDLGPGNHGPTLWRFDTAGQRMVRAPFDLRGTQILVLAGCHFSVDAASDIVADRALGPLFAVHAHWLFLPPGDEDVDAARDWNRRFPDAPVGLIYSKDEWPFLPTDWPMPTFLFLRDGKIVERVTGWPRQPASNRQPLIDAARRQGLLPTP